MRNAVRRTVMVTIKAMTAGESNTRKRYWKGWGNREDWNRPYETYHSIDDMWAALQPGLARTPTNEKWLRTLDECGTGCSKEITKRRPWQSVYSWPARRAVNFDQVPLTLAADQNVVSAFRWRNIVFPFGPICFSYYGLSIQRKPISRTQTGAFITSL